MSVLRCTIRHILVILWVFSTHYSHGQNVEFCHVVKYTTAQGLSSYNIRKIIKDKNGYTWIATQYGLSRFDGKQFVNYSKSGLPGYKLCGVDIRDFVEDPTNDLLWVFPGGGGFNCIDLKTQRVANEYLIPYKDVEEFGMAAALLHNSLWLGSSTGLRVFDKVADRFEERRLLPEKINGNHDFEAQCLFTDSYGNLWCFYNGYGVAIYNGKTKEKIKQCPLNAFNDHLHTGKIVFNGCVAMGKNRMLVATSQGLREIEFDLSYNVRINDNPCTYFPKINSEQIEAICSTRRGAILVASHSELFRLDNSMKKYTVIKEAEASIEGDWLSSVQYIYCDADDNIWLGCEQGLAFIHGNESPFQPYYFDPQTNLKLDHVRSIYVAANGDILAGLRNGIAKIDFKTKRYSISDEDHLYHHIYEDKAGKIHVARPDGLFIYSEGQLSPIELSYPEFKPYSKNPINSDVSIGDSLIVSGTENDKGILIWNYKQHKVRQIDNGTDIGLASDVVNNIYLDRRGRLWVLSDHIASILSAGFTKMTPLVIYDSATKNVINLLFDICEAKGSYWIAAYGTGLVQLDSSFRVKKIFNTQSGLPDNGVYLVFPTGNQILITTDKGLSVFDIEKRTFKNYFREDGLHSNSFEEVAGVMKGNLIYAGGVKGFTIIDPSRFTTNTFAPKVYINRIFVDRANQSRDIDTTNIGLKELDIPNDVLQTSIYFSGINYSSPERTTFAYRIKEHNNDWVNIGTQSYINLIGLSPGTYHLEVKAANEDDVWSLPVSIALIYQPRWYQTWWFKALLVLMGAGIGYIIYRVRIDQIFRQQKIRKEIASDLHDDIGSSLNSVKIFARLAKTDSSPQKYIRSIEENLELATIGLRDMIWVLDDKLDSVEDLCDRLKQFSVKPAEATGIAVDFNITDMLPYTNLSKPVKRNLFLIAKEAINNSVKYAKCEHIRIIFRLKSKKLTMIIWDDGKGFDVSAISQGYGLANIKTRADQIYFNFNIKSDSSGTEIIISAK